MRTLIIGTIVAGLAGAPVAAFAAMHTVTVALHAQRGSGESGRAIMTAEGARTKVLIEIEHAPKGIAQPAHIHMGTCSKLNPMPAWKLKPVVNGRSVTVVPVSMAKLLHGKYAFNVHKSFKQIRDYVACGDIVEKN